MRFNFFKNAVKVFWKLERIFWGRVFNAMSSNVCWKMGEIVFIGADGVYFKPCCIKAACKINNVIFRAADFAVINVNEIGKLNAAFSVLHSGGGYLDRDAI